MTLSLMRKVKTPWKPMLWSRWYLSHREEKLWYSLKIVYLFLCIICLQKLFRACLVIKAEKILSSFLFITVEGEESIGYIFISSQLHIIVEEPNSKKLYWWAYAVRKSTIFIYWIISFCFTYRHAFSQHNQEKHFQWSHFSLLLCFAVAIELPVEVL